MLENLILIRETTSTNDLVRSYSPGTALVSESQTQGRGRHGKTWLSLQGGLYFSYKTKGSFCEVAQLSSILAGVAVHQTLNRSLGLKLKWPNDLVLEDGRKLGGILVERYAETLIFGIGLNLDTSQGLTSKYARLTSPTEKIGLLLKIIEQLHCWSGRPSSELIDYWMKYNLFKPGEIVKFRQGLKVTEAIYKGVSEQGALCVASSGGDMLALHSGEVDQVRAT